MYRTVEATRDLLPDEIGPWQTCEDTARSLFRCYGFREIRTPIFEFTELFARSVGEQTDIVSKEMYTFTDRGGRSLTLRPEGTAPAVRAFVQRRIHRSEDLTRWYYTGPMFRYERKQKGRFRQFFQIGAEVLGADSPVVDVETIEMVLHYLTALGVSGMRLHLNSVGCRACRPPYTDLLRQVLDPQIGSYCKDCQRRFETNVLRVLDCKVDVDRAAGLPVLVEHLCDACGEHFAAVRDGLASLGVEFDLAPRLVRGLDYYVRTAFEVTASGLGAQNALVGGGRYDGLVSQLGGPDVPGFGFALGLDRLVMILPEEAGKSPVADIHLVVVGSEAMRRARQLATRLRHAGLIAALDVTQRSVKAQMRAAARSGARHTLVIGENELSAGRATLRRLEDGVEAEFALDALAELVEEIRHAGSR
ncbi:MAG: histidine--tRNA ligase [Acidobacteriota bacterium]